MSQSIQLHDPVRVTVTEFQLGGEDRACIHFRDAGGSCHDIYTTPRIANAIAEAFGDARAADENAAEAYWEAANDPEAIAARQHAHDDALRDAGRGHLVRS